MKRWRRLGRKAHRALVKQGVLKRDDGTAVRPYNRHPPAVEWYLFLCSDGRKRRVHHSHGTPYQQALWLFKRWPKVEWATSVHVGYTYTRRKLRSK